VLSYTHQHYVDMRKHLCKPVSADMAATCTGCRSNGMGYEEQKGDSEISRSNSGVVKACRFMGHDVVSFGV
jgi:hypothetical protein